MKKLALIATLLCTSCDLFGPKAPETPEFTCGTACMNLRDIGCDEGEDTSEGSTCEDVCESTFEGGIKEFRWNVEELTATDICEE